MNFSVSPAKILTASWRNWARERLLDRVDADVEYQAAASEWRARVVDVLKSRAPVAAPAQLAASGAVNDIHTSHIPKTRR